VAAAKAGIDSGDYDRPDSGYGLLAIPEFRNVDSWVKGDHFGFNISMTVKFYRPDESKVTRIKGQGDSTTGFFGPSPGESGSLALRKAVEAVMDGVCQEGNKIL
jgi:hypothetical protein